MWQKVLQPYIDSGAITAIGVVQEQHPDRTRLYRQWRQLDWPIFVDSMNVLDLDAVPIPLAIDESGILRLRRPKTQSIIKDFIEAQFPKTEVTPDYNRAQRPDLEALRKQAAASDDALDWRRLGEALFNFGTESDITESIAALAKSTQLDPSDGRARFRLGVALRKRSEGARREIADAQAAVEHWGQALAINPNQYIWRRRIQQYGPRLDKPYNFYFWVEQARQEISARGEEPFELVIEPTGSEIAPPQRSSGEFTAQTLINPDPEARINTDRNGLIRIEPVLTPARVRPGQRVQARVTFRPNEKSLPWWNNEVDDMMMWTDLPEHIQIAENQLTFPNPKEPETREVRTVEFELKIDLDAPVGSMELPAYALYYVCENEGGVCLYLRQDFKLVLNIDPEAPMIR